MELQTMYHLITKDKIAEKHILGKYSNCNSNNFIVAITQLFNVPEVWNFTMW